jgi:hypothetical protein
VIPKATYFGRTAEVAFYESFFSRVAVWLRFDAAHWRAAYEEACNSGIGGIDAIHVIVADLSGCDELITTERAGKAIHRTKKIRVISIAE